MACVGFLGLYRISRPDNLTLTQHKHFHVSKRFSLTGCLVSSIAFLFYFVESTVINKVQQKPTLWDGDPPLLWPIDGEWRVPVALMGIVALSLSTFEFLIPLCITVTQMANDGLLYKNLRETVGQIRGKWGVVLNNFLIISQSSEESSITKWGGITPLVFGGICALHAMLIDAKVLLGLVSSSLLCIHILVCSSMIAMRYQVRQTQSPKRNGHTRTRPRTRSSESGLVTSPTASSRPTTRRMLAVSFLKSGLGKIPRGEMLRDMGNVCPSSTNGRSSSMDIDASNDRSLLMEEVEHQGQSSEQT